MAAINMKQDMGSGSIPKLMLNLAIPAVVAQLINMLYNIVDRIYIGHIPDAGASALTGVGLFLPILMMVNAFAMIVMGMNPFITTQVTLRPHRSRVLCCFHG